MTMRSDDRPTFGVVAHTAIYLLLLGESHATEWRRVDNAVNNNNNNNNNHDNVYGAVIMT